MPNFQNSFGWLGTVKNPVLFCTTVFTVSSSYFFHDLVKQQDALTKFTGTVVVFLSVICFLLALGFYIFAFLRLPSSTQEAIFLQEAKIAMDRHKKISSKVRIRKKSS